MIHLYKILIAIFCYHCNILLLTPYNNIIPNLIKKNKTYIITN